MSAGLPYPVSNNRASYPSSDPSSAYHPPPANPQYPYPSYSARSAGFEANHGRVDASGASSSLSGMFHHAEHDQQQQYSRSAHPADAFPHPQSHGEQREHVWHYAQAVADAPRARLDHPSLDMNLAREYQNSLAHTSVGSTSHGHGVMANTSPTSHRSPTSGSGTGRSRREKPRLELASDQPLTTQGKPRMRVYVACVQWWVSLALSAPAKLLTHGDCPVEAGKSVAMELNLSATTAVGGQRTPTSARTTPRPSGVDRTGFLEPANVRREALARSRRGVEGVLQRRMARTSSSWRRRVLPSVLST